MLNKYECSPAFCSPCRLSRGASFFYIFVVLKRDFFRMLPAAIIHFCVDISIFYNFVVFV